MQPSCFKGLHGTVETEYMPSTKPWAHWLDESSEHWRRIVRYAQLYASNEHNNLESNSVNRLYNTFIAGNVSVLGFRWPMHSEQTVVWIFPTMSVQIVLLRALMSHVNKCLLNSTSLYPWFLLMTVFAIYLLDRQKMWREYYCMMDCKITCPQFVKQERHSSLLKNVMRMSWVTFCWLYHTSQTSHRVRTFHAWSTLQPCSAHVPGVWKSWRHQSVSRRCSTSTKEYCSW